MAGVTDELLFEMSKHIRRPIDSPEDGHRSIGQQPMAMRGDIRSLQMDVSNIYQVLGRHDARLDRIERRLNIVEEPAG
ncbi:MAG: hypothetical protein ACFBWO_17185 [Paracoccaceae bacterium]